MIEVSLLTAFFTGILTFFAPCTFVTLPSFISYLVMEVTGPKEERRGKYRLRVILSALSYILGFLTVFTLLGLTATSVGSLFSHNKESFLKIGAIIIIILGLFLLVGDKIRPLHFLFQQRKMEVRADRLTKGYFFPLAVGITSAFAWTPCVGPILGAILFLAGSTTSAAWQGAALLFAYGFGITVPFLLIAISIDYSEKYLRRLNKLAPLLHRLSAILLILLGITMLTGFSDTLFGVAYQIFIKIGFQPR